MDDFYTYFMTGALMPGRTWPETVNRAALPGLCPNLTGSLLDTEGHMKDAWRDSSRWTRPRCSQGPQHEVVGVAHKKLPCPGMAHP